MGSYIAALEGGMPIYYLNKQLSSEHHYEIHTLDCMHGPLLRHRYMLDWYLSSYDALLAAKARFPLLADRIHPCYFCCNERRQGT